MLDSLIIESHKEVQLPANKPFWLYPVSREVFMTIKKTRRASPPRVFFFFFFVYSLYFKLPAYKADVLGVYYSRDWFFFFTSREDRLLREQRRTTKYKRPRNLT